MDLSGDHETLWAGRPS